MVSAFTEVWTSITTYILGLFGDIEAIFITANSGGTGYTLTFVGVLAVIMAGVSLVLLAFNLIRSFLRMRG